MEIVAQAAELPEPSGIKKKNISVTIHNKELRENLIFLLYFLAYK